MKITKVENPKTKVIQAKTKNTPKGENMGYKWWNAASAKQRAEELITTAKFLQSNQDYHYRQAVILARLYGNIPLTSIIGSSSKIGPQSALPMDRPTMNVIQSCIDTLVSRITQSRPRPIFLTDNSDYKQRNLAKKLNGFIGGELYRTKAYELGKLILRDASVLGTGLLHVYEKDKKVCLERVLKTELFVDPNESLYAHPRQLYRMKLVDREVLADQFPEYKSKIEGADNAYPDNQSQESIADQVLVVESWRLPSGMDSGDGMHSIACSAGEIFKEEWTKDYFPFEFLHYSPRLVGFWGQSLAEQLMGTQVEINQLLATITKSIHLVGVPRVFVEDGSKVVKAHLNNQVGSIITYRGTKPSYEVAPCIAPEIYQQLQRLVEYAYQQSGVSALAATSQKPAGLNSGEAIRNYDDLQSDRFASLNKDYDNFYVSLSYKIVDLAKEIAEREGEYTTIYPNKNGVKEIDFPKLSMLDNPYLIQCFDASSLPREPAGRLQKVTEMAQAGMISMQEARRLLDYPDLEQVDKLATAQEERILQVLDDVVETGKYMPPDPFTDLAKATELSTQYINLYSSAGLEESKLEKLRNYFTQVQALVQAAQPPAPPPGAAPQGVPAARPVSDVLPNAPAAG